MKRLILLFIIVFIAIVLVLFAASQVRTTAPIQTANSGGGLQYCSDDLGEIEICNEDGEEILDIDFNKSKKTKKTVAKKSTTKKTVKKSTTKKSSYKKRK